jgi:hypothetical protein
MFTLLYLATSQWHETNSGLVAFLAIVDLVLLMFACIIFGAVAVSFA